jgi:hypothetical protein
VKHFRQDHCILTVNEAGHCTERLVYASINAAKRANRETRYRRLDKGKVPQAQDYKVVRA